jgi:hypothetical protein
MFGDPVEDEGDTVFGLVVNDLRHLVDWWPMYAYMRAQV